MIVDLSPAGMLFLLIAAHCYLDYAGQGDFMATAKDPTSEIGENLWRWVLPSHGMIHGGAVFAITGDLRLGIAEFVIHSLVDWLKCNRVIGFGADQSIHIVCKIAWTWIVIGRFVIW